MAYIIRRRKLGRTSTREICRNSQTGLTTVLHDRDPIPPNQDLVFRWGCTANVPQRRVVNTAEAIHFVNDKSRFREHLLGESPNIVPSSIFSYQDWFDASFGENEPILPVIVRPRHHHQGRRFFVCNDEDEVRQAFRRAGAGAYASKLIDKVAEYRVFCANGRVVCVAEKTPGNPQDIAWNVARGGRFDNVRWDEWPLRAVRISLEAFALSGLDFGGVDIMVDGEGRCYVLEINSAPSLTSEYRQECFAKVFDWIVNNGKDQLPLTKVRGGYRKFIHPAVCNRAILVGA